MVMSSKWEASRFVPATERESEDPSGVGGESAAAMRAFLQRAEVRLSTIHRVGQALLGGSALVLLLPLFLRDGFPKVAAVLVAGHDANQHWLVLAGTGIAAGVSMAVPVLAIFLLVSDLLGFYFTSNTFGAPGGDGDSRTVFNPRFIIPGLGMNDDEIDGAAAVELDDGRADAWTRALLIPRSSDDGGWRDRFDARTAEIWGVAAQPGPAGDDARLRQQFRLAGLHSGRTLALDVARTEALLARHVLGIRIAVLRYAKALLLLVTTTVATLATSGVVEEALRQSPDGGRLTGGFPYRYFFLISLVYTLWAPGASRSVTAPLRMIHRQTPGVGENRDVYRDRQLTQFESAIVLATLMVLVGSVASMVTAGYLAGGAGGLAVGIGLGAVGLALWVLSVRGHDAGVRQTVEALLLILRGREAPAVTGGPSQDAPR